MHYIKRRWISLCLWLLVSGLLFGCHVTPPEDPADRSDTNERNDINSQHNEVCASILDIAPVSQYPLYPTGCESVTTVMALLYAGVDISVEEFIQQHLPCDGNFYSNGGKRYGPDPYAVFVGDPRSTASYGCMAPVIESAIISCLPDGYSVIDTTGRSLVDLCYEYIRQGQPVIVWASMEMRAIQNGNSWYLENGTLFVWPAGEHCLLLVGYDERNYYFNDPHHGRRVAYEKTLSESRYREMGMQSLVIR